MKSNGFYIIKDEFFDAIDDPYLKTNKAGHRPHYYCFKDDTYNVYWMIPLSSKVEKYKRIIENKSAKGKKTDTLYITVTYRNKESAFLIQDMFPITENFIEREFTVDETQLVLKNERDIKEIEKRAKRISRKLLKGIKFTPTSPDVIKILNKIIINEDD